MTTRRDAFEPLLHSLCTGLALLTACAAAQAVPRAGLGTWETTLHARDINGDGTIDAYYDSALNLTWLADPKAGAGSNFDDGYSPTDGRMTYAGASNWLASLNVHGVTGWHFAPQISSLYHTTLGNSSIPGSFNVGWYNTGPFLNVTDNSSALSGWYWTGQTPSDDPSCTPYCPKISSVFWADGVGAGIYTNISVNSSMSVWAVHDGDVPVTSVPEPQTYAFMLVGLAALAVVARRHRERDRS